MHWLFDWFFDGLFADLLLITGIAIAIGAVTFLFLYLRHLLGNPIGNLLPIAVIIVGLPLLYLLREHQKGDK